MANSLSPRKALKWSLYALAGLIVAIGVFLGIVASLDASHFRGMLIHIAEEQTEHPIRVAGPMQVHFFSRTPSVIADQVSIGNPSWMPPGDMAEVGRLSLTFDLLPLLSNSFVIRRLDLQAATLHLTRNADGHSNWQTHVPGSGPGGGPPLIHSLTMVNARVDLDDARRQLKFAGVVSAQEIAGVAGAPPLRIDGSGQLNGRPVTFSIDSDPLAGISHDRPYGFEFVERSSGSRLSGRGDLPHPLDFLTLETTFEGSGEDLKDLYFLTGLDMPNTGAYRLSGEFSRERTHFHYSDLAVSSGQSDLHGTLSIESAHGHTKIDADLHSQVLRSADIGERAAGRAREPEGANALMLPDYALPLAGIRRGDAVVNYHAQRFDLGHVALHGLAAHVTIDHGLLVIAPVSAAYLDGRVSGRIGFDATQREPTAELDLHMADLQISRFDHKGKGPPPLNGLLQVRAILKGHGSSVHQLAAHSSGSITAALPQGAIRASFAELTGMDIARGLGMVLRKDQQETPVRCGIANFEDRDGTLSAQSLVIDSEPVLISGTGQIRLDSETLDLALHGRPKSMRLLRLHSPVVIRGTLSHPTIGLDTHNAKLAIVDRGVDQEVDCPALLRQAKANGVDVDVSATTH